MQIKELKCEVSRIEIIPAMRLVRFWLPALNCTDMGGAIRVATRHCPAVSRIETFAGNEPDTVYMKSGDAWQAASPNPTSTTNPTR